MKATDKVFPLIGEDIHEFGLDARDYIAVQAMTGMLANRKLTDCSFSKMAEFAYRQADAMLKESEKCTKVCNTQ